MKKQLLTREMKVKRLDWARKHKKLTVEDWRRVLFSDESHFYVQGQRSQHVRRSPEEKVSEHHIDQAVKHPEKKMLWGSFSYSGVGSLRPIDGMMNSEKYVRVVESCVVNDMQKAFPGGDGVFQHDRAPCHTSKMTTAALKKKKIKRNFESVIM